MRLPGAHPRFNPISNPSPLAVRTAGAESCVRNFFHVYPSHKYVAYRRIISIYFHVTSRFFQPTPKEET